MDFTKLTEFWPYIQQLIAAGPVIRDIIDTAQSNDDAITKLKKIVPQLMPLLEKVGAKLFPQAAGPLHALAGAIATYQTTSTKWIQTACNTLLSPSPNLVVDGVYGERTREAVAKLQKQLGLEADGMVGRITQAAIGTALAKA